MKVVDVIGACDLPLDELGHVLTGTAGGPQAAHRIEINIVDPTATMLAPTEWREVDAGIQAIVMRWFSPGAAFEPLAGIGIEPLWTLTVDEQLAIGQRYQQTRAEAVKHITFLRRAVAEAEFVRQYRHHVDLVREHLPGIGRYIQNEVRASDYPGRAIDAVSELVFHSPADYEQRWVHGAQGQREFRSHERFLDLRGALQVACAEHVSWVAEPSGLTPA